MAAPKLKSFTVYRTITAQFSIDIKAKTMVEALAEAEKTGVGQFVNGELVDVQEDEITGIFS